MRNSGKTKSMVEGLPESGSVVVVHAMPLRSYLRDMILTVRGSEVLGRTKIEVVRGIADADRLRGVRQPVFVDHAFFEADMRPEVVAKVRQLADGANTRFRKAG